MYKKFGLFIAPFLMFALYVLFTYGIAFLVSSSVWASLVADSCMIVLYFVLGRRKWKPDASHVSFSPHAWSVFLWFFIIILLWISTQIMALCISQNVDVTGMEAYSEAVSSDIGLYLVLAIFVAPLAEEFLFRGFMMQTWKRCTGPLVAGLLSAALFAVIHGTLLHLPVAFLMGLFNAMLYELTGQIDYSVISHVLYNFLSVSTVIPIAQESLSSVLLSVPFTIGLGIFWLLIIGVMYRYRIRIRDYITSPHLIDELNRKWDE